MSSDRDPLINRSSSNNDTQASEGIFDRLIRPSVAEFFGVTLFVFIGTSAVHSATASGAGLVAVAVAHGFAIAILVAGLGAISGAHLNPAVTLGIAVAGAISPVTAIAYFICQLLGGILGSALTKAILSPAAYHNISGGATLLGSANAGEGFLCEVILTCLLVTTVLLSAVDSSTKNSLAPLAIGFTVVICILAGGPISGASMNPARSLGPAVVGSGIGANVWSNHWVFWLGPASGALLAVGLYRFILAGREKRLPPFGNRAGS